MRANAHAARPALRRIRTTVKPFLFYALLMGCWSLLCADRPAYAQAVQYTQNTADLALRSDLKVDPSTLGMSLEIPLGAYPGRAGAGLPVSLRYSSKLWRMEYAGHTDLNPHAQGWTTPRFAEDSAAGWTTSLGAPVLKDGTMEMTFNTLGGLPDCPTSFPCLPQENKYVIFRFFVQMPDGSTHEVRKSDSAVLVDPPTNPPADATGTYYAVDGSRMRLEYYTGVNAPPNVLYLADGSRYIWDDSSGATVIKSVDRNSNTLTFNASTRQWTDTLGRVLNNPPPITPTASDQTYTLPGVNGSSITYTMRWRNLADVRTNQSEPLRYTANWSLCNLSYGNPVSPSLFGGCTDESPTLFNPIVLSEVVLPTGLSYRFTYNVYGEIDKVFYPTGGYERYRYEQVPSVSYAKGNYAQTNRGVVERWVSAKGDGTDETHWQYAASFADNQNRTLPYTVTTTAPDNSRTERLLHAQQNSPPRFRLDNVLTGMAYEERAFSATGQMLRRTLTEWGGDNGTESYPIRNPRVVKQVAMLLDTGGNALATTTTHLYDSDQNPVSTSEYDFAQVSPATAQTGAIGSIPAGTPLRTSETTFLVSDTAIDAGTRAAYRARNLLSLPTSSRVRNAAGTVVAQGEVKYDESNYPLVAYGAVTSWTDPSTTLRGNATTSRSWIDTTGAWVETHAQYDQCGSPVNSWDAKGNLSQVGYSPLYAYAYPTQTVSAVPDPTGAYGSNTSLVSTSVYDFATGLVTSTTDANGQTTSFEHNDPLGRLTKVNNPDGGWTSYGYGASLNAGFNNLYVRTLTALDATRAVESYQFFDGLGRPTRSFASEGGSPAVFITTDTQYDAMGRAWRSSNPYRTNGSGDAINPSGRWTQTTFDALGRLTQLKTTADNAVVTTSYSGNTVTVTDQAGKQRSSVSDALGRLAQVTEDPTTGGLNYVTSYTYDVTGNLRKVDQGGQVRFFMYDSLGRLIRARNPEQSAGSAVSNITDTLTGNSQWSLAYGYDANGNLTARVDARDITTNYTYDNLNRNTYVAYSDSTPHVKRIYDTAVNGRGRFRGSWTFSAAGAYYTHTAVDNYDAAGRALDTRQHFYTNNVASAAFTTRVTYDVGGQVKTGTYPSGRTVAYGYDAAGRLNSFTGNLGDGVSRTYSTGVTYSEMGGIRQEQYGTQAPLYHKLHYNVRGQLYDVRLSTVAWAGDEWNWNRGALINYYATADLTSPSNEARAQSGADNNGNVIKQQHWVPADEQLSSYNWTDDTFTYDSLNRLKTVTEQPGTQAGLGAQSYVQTFDYDRYGNRTINGAGTWGVAEPQFELQPQTNQEVAEPSNRLYALGDANRAPTQKLMRYDAAGNLTYDAFTGQGSRVYDAENRITTAQDSYQQWSTYIYDADGRRVKRVTANEEWWQVYGVGGELVAEYRAGSAAMTATKEYGYRGGELLVTMSSGDDGRVKRFVTNLYYGALQRDPTTAELTDKSNQLADAGAQGQTQLLAKAQEIARSLFTSTSYETTNGRSDMQYVSDLYYAYLQRAPDDGGLGWWAPQAASSRVNVCNAFEGSSEFATLVNTLYGTAASDNERTEHFVNDFYLGAMGRNATSVELQQQRDALNVAAAQSQSSVQTQAETMGRTLFASQVTDFSITAQQFVTNLYEGFLQRGPDAGGFAFWTGQAGNTSQSRQNVLNAFATTGAFRELSGTLYRETFWLVGDHLGTPRMVVDRSGSLAGVKRHDYLPFGEELLAGTGGRTTTQGYGASDNVRQKFTGYERDGETGLDFAQARYYSNIQGRFTSPDEFSGGPDEVYSFAAKAATNPTFYADLTNPQSLNKYQYCVNSPLRYIDPDGHSIRLTNASAADRREVKGRLLFNLAKNERKYFGIKHDAKTGEYKLEIKENINRALSQPHTKALEYMVQTVRDRDTVRVAISDTFQNKSGEQKTADFGGGVTVNQTKSLSGDVEVYLSRQQPPNVMGENGQMIDMPSSIGAGHEVLGHARAILLNPDDYQSYDFDHRGNTIDVENELREGRGLPRRAKPE